MAITTAEAQAAVRALWAAFPEDAYSIAKLLKQFSVALPSQNWIGLVKTEVATRPTTGLSVAWMQNELQRYFDGA